jgi:NADH-quinone oxidoreductase subunit J
LKERHVSAIDSIYFYAFAALALTGALGVVVPRSPIRAAMGLLLLILSVAALFLRLRAEFLAAIQLIVYAGAIVVLFLFVIMLLGPSSDVPADRRGFVARAFAGGLFAITGAGAVVALARLGPDHAAVPRTDTGFGGIEAFGSVLFSDALVPFEVSSALLMVAVIGAIAVARGRQGARTMSRAERTIAASPPVVDRPEEADHGGVFSHEIHVSEAKEHSA